MVSTKMFKQEKKESSIGSLNKIMHLHSLSIP
jgi:hypothetical protein